MTKQKQDKTVLLSKLKKISYNFLSSLTVHGVPRIIKSNNSLVRLVWTALIIISVYFGISNIVKTVHEYWAFGVTTKVERFYPKEVTFPAITICTENFFRLRESGGWNYNKFVFNDPSILLSFIDISYSLWPNEYNSSENLEFFEIPKYYGTCLRFNGNQENLVKIQSKSQRLLLNVHPHSRDGRYSLSQIRIYVTENYVNSYLDIEPLELRIFGNDLYPNINIVKSEMEIKLSEPFSTCNDKNKYYQMNCVEECMNQEISAKFNCSIPSYYEIKSLERCGRVETYSTDYIEFQSERSFELSLKLTNLTNEFRYFCMQRCQQECHLTKFTIAQVASTGFIVEELFFQVTDLSTLVITQVPKMTVFTLISSIGGSLGLFIGARFLSLVEVLELVIELSYTLIFDRK